MIVIDYDDKFETRNSSNSIFNKARSVRFFDLRSDLGELQEVLGI